MKHPETAGQILIDWSRLTLGELQELLTRHGGTRVSAGRLRAGIWVVIVSNGTSEGDGQGPTLGAALVQALAQFVLMVARQVPPAGGPYVGG